MREGRDWLFRKVARVAASVSPGAVDSLCRALDRLPANAGAAEVHQALQAVGSTRARARLDELVGRWIGVPAPQPAAVLSAALRAARAAVQQERARQSTDLVWTGPAPHNTTFRRTDQALLELIEGASKSLLIVTFVAYKVDHIRAALEARVDAGVKVTLVLEDPGQSDGYLSHSPLDALGETLSTHASVYLWPLDQRPTNDIGKPAKLHAKCAVADSNVALISSANLTGDALRRNMEMGVLVRGGGLAASIERHFRSLVADGSLVGLEG